MYGEESNDLTEIILETLNTAHIEKKQKIVLESKSDAIILNTFKPSVSQAFFSVNTDKSKYYNLCRIFI